MSLSFEAGLRYFGHVPRDLQLSDTMAELCGFIEVHDSIDSTNVRMRQCLDEVAEASALPPYGSVGMICADLQTAGKGRQTRPWVSPPGLNIYCSFGFCLPASVDLSGLSLAVGLALRSSLLAGFMQENASLEYVPNIQVKWPNDVFFNESKVAGILIEAFQKRGCWWVTIGAGVNVNMTDLPASVELNRAWTSMALAAEKTFDRSRLIELFLVRLVSCVSIFQRTGWASFAKEWLDADWLFGRDLSVPCPLPDQPQRLIVGKGCGVNECGQLLLQDAGGYVHSIVSGEVSVEVKAAVE